MARSKMPKGKLVRRFGVNIFGNPKYDRLLVRRSDPPGQHGSKQLRQKRSNYGRQLLEKQKLKNSYGLLERQFRRTFERALRQPGVTGDNLLVLLEMRLDNLVYRAGLATSRTQARQLVSHGHLQVNGRKVDIPSCQLRVGARVTVREGGRSRELLMRLAEDNRRRPVAPWLASEAGAGGFTISRRPLREEIDVAVNEQLVVELYAR